MNEARIPVIAIAGHPSWAVTLATNHDGLVSVWDYAATTPGMEWRIRSQWVLDFLNANGTEPAASLGVVVDWLCSNGYIELGAKGMVEKKPDGHKE